MELVKLIDFLLQQFVIAGDYAVRIQPRIKSNNIKGGNIFQAALTDADLSVQNMFEVALLADFPQLRFFGEEEDKSLNAKYFPEHSEYEVTLDPINGTRLFVDQFNTFDIVLAVTKNEEPVAAIDYLPAKQEFYFALRGQGAFRLTRDEVVSRAHWHPFVLSPASETVMLFEDEDLHSRLDKHFKTVDLVREYLLAPSDLTLNSILRGGLGGWVRRDSHLIDLGAIAFIAQQAGGLVTDFFGRPLPPFFRENGRAVPEHLVAASAQLHSRILERLAQR